MKKISCLLMLFALAGCFFSTPQSRFYILETTDSRQIVSTRKINIAVADITIPAYLDQPQIVLQKQGSPELKISEFNRWASDLNTLLKNQMIGDLRTMLPQAVIKPLSYGTTPLYIVRINLEKLIGWPGEDAYLNGSWQILNSRGKILYEQNFNRKLFAGKSFDSYVAAQSQMWADTAREIAVKIAAM